MLRLHLSPREKRRLWNRQLPQRKLPQFQRTRQTQSQQTPPLSLRL